MKTKKNNLKILIFYGLLIVAVVLSLSTFFGQSNSNEPKYSDVINYFKNDDETQDPVVTWRSHANLLYSNWLNYFVYQTTPYYINAVDKK